MGYEKSFFRRLDSAEEDGRLKDNMRVVKLCCEMRLFIKEATFTKYKKAEQLLSYWGEPNDYVAQQINISPSRVRVARTELSRELFDLFGNDFFTVLSNGDIKSIRECRRRFELVSSNKKAKDYIPREYIDYISRNSEIENFEIHECQKEISFLVKYCTPSFKSECAKLDMDKLFYLIRVLNREAGEISDTYNFMNIMNTQNPIMEQDKGASKSKAGDTKDE